MMKIMLKNIIILILLGFSITCVYAKNEPSLQSLDQAFQEHIVAEVLMQNIQFEFGSAGSLKGQIIDEVEAEGHGHVGTNDLETIMGCQLALRKALIILQKRTKKIHGTAVISINSMHGDKAMKSKSQYYCGIGRVKTEVKLKGTVIRIGIKN